MRETEIQVFVFIIIGRDENFRLDERSAALDVLEEDLKSQRATLAQDPDFGIVYCGCKTVVEADLPESSHFQVSCFLCFLSSLLFEIHKDELDLRTHLCCGRAAS